MSVIRDQDGVAHVVGLSGGKDSTALALRLVEMEPRPYTYICNETGDELPDMVQHWALLETALGPLVRVTARDDDGLPLTLNAAIDREGMLPNFRARWCTRVLKIEPTLELLPQVAPAVLYVGIRADEPDREGMTGQPDGVTVRYPLREWGWGEPDVWRYLDAQGVTIPPRTDCARCFYQTIWEWRELWRNYPDIYADAEAQEGRLGHTFRSDGRDTWPASLYRLRQEFERERRINRIPGGSQFDLFGANCEPRRDVCFFGCGR